MKHAHSLLAAVAILAIAPNAIHAVPFDNSSSATPATAVVGLSGDYLTLSAAATAFSALSGVNRPWVLTIQNDVTEASGCYFGATFGANGSLTIRPAPGATPTVTFTNTNNPTGYDGHLVFGAKNGTTINLPTTPASSGRYILDGCNTPGGTSRDLTIQAGTPALSLASGSDYLLNIVGDTDNAIVRNANLGMYDTAGLSGAVVVSAVVVTGNTLIPDGCQIQNCALTGGGTTSNASGVSTLDVSGGGLTSGQGIQNLSVTDCDIAGRQYGVSLRRCASANIERNSITVDGGTNTAIQYGGIGHIDGNAFLGMQFVIRRNLIDVTAPAGATGIDMNPGSTATGLYIVDDNIVRDITFTGLASPTAVNYRGICGQSGTCSYFIEHNSLNLPNQANISIGSQQQVTGILLTQSIGSPRTASVTNNIVHMPQTGFGQAALSFASPINTTCDRNCLLGGDAIGWMGSFQYTTLTGWQNGGGFPGFTGFDDNGQSVNPTTTTPAWDGDLHFSSKPVAGLATVSTSSFTTDFDGDPRPGSGALPGADEPVTITSVEGWAAY